MAVQVGVAGGANASPSLADAPSYAASGASRRAGLNIRLNRRTLRPMVYDDSELRPEMLSDRDYAALQEVERARPWTFGRFLFGVADDVAAGVVVGLTVAIGSCFGIGVAVVVVVASRGIDAMLAAALPPIGLYAALQLPAVFGLVDFGASRHPHLYPSVLGLAFVFATLAWWGVILAAFG